MARLVASFRGGRRRQSTKPEWNLAGVYRAPGWIPFHLIAYPLRLSGAAEVGQALVFAAVFEERLFHALRDGGQAYAASVTVERDNWQTFLVVQVPMGPEASPMLERTLIDLLSTTARAEIDATTLERNQRHVLEGLCQLADDPSSWVASPLAREGTDATVWIESGVQAATGPGLLESIGVWIEPSRAIHLELDPTLRPVRPARAAR
jgi:hypothetical protein